MSYTNKLHFNNISHDGSIVTIHLGAYPGQTPDLGLFFSSRNQPDAEAFLPAENVAEFANTIRASLDSDVNLEFQLTDGCGCTCLLNLTTDLTAFGVRAPLDSNERELLVALRAPGAVHPAVMAGNATIDFYNAVAEALDHL